MNLGLTEIVILLIVLGMPIVVIVAVVLFITGRSKKSRDDMKKCSFCAYTIPADAKVCQFCGSELVQ